jgi:hypothetical protein
MLNLFAKCMNDKPVLFLSSLAMHGILYAWNFLAVSYMCDDLIRMHLDRSVA